MMPDTIMTGTTQFAGINPMPRIVYSEEDGNELTSHPPFDEGISGGSGRVDSLITAPAQTAAVKEGARNAPDPGHRSG